MNSFFFFLSSPFNNDSSDNKRQKNLIRGESRTLGTSATIYWLVAIRYYHKLSYAVVTGITESKLGDSVLSSEIHIGNYNTIRCDRSYKTNNLSYDVKSFFPPETENIFLKKML